MLAIATNLCRFACWRGGGGRNGNGGDKEEKGGERRRKGGGRRGEKRRRRYELREEGKVTIHLPSIMHKLCIYVHSTTLYIGAQNVFSFLQEPPAKNLKSGELTE